MGLVADAMVLAKSGHAKTSGGLNLLLGLRLEEECNYYVQIYVVYLILPTDLVWSAIATHVSNLVSAWWEQPKIVRDGIDAFRRVRRLF